MPYRNIDELPDNVRKHLPKHAQDIYMGAFNNAWEKYGDPSERKGYASKEETAHKIAWAAVKKEYHKNEQTGEWERLSHSPLET